jgi:hypothetical protein
MHRRVWVSLSLLMFLSVPVRVQADCDRLQRFPQDCCSPKGCNWCSKTVNLYHCLLGTSSSQNCEDNTGVVYCCGEPWETGAYTGPCGSAPSAALREAADADPWVLANVYVPSCEGGLVPLKTALRVDAQRDASPGEAVQSELPEQTFPDGSRSK